MRSDITSMQRQLQSCIERQLRWDSQMSKWRDTFGLIAKLGSSAEAAPEQGNSELMQVSPVGGEGSNVMPRLAAGPDPSEVRRGARQGSSPPNGVTQAMRDSTPHAGSTAGEQARLETPTWPFLQCEPCANTMHAQKVMPELGCFLQSECVCCL